MRPGIVIGRGTTRRCLDLETDFELRTDSLQRVCSMSESKLCAHLESLPGVPHVEGCFLLAQPSQKNYAGVVVASAFASPREDVLGARIYIRLSDWHHALNVQMHDR